MIWLLPHTFCRKTVYVRNFAWNFYKLHKRHVLAPITAQTSCLCTINFEVAKKKSRRNWVHRSKDYVPAKWFGICPTLFAKKLFMSEFFAWNFDKLHKRHVFAAITVQKTCFCTNYSGVARKKSVEYGSTCLKITFLQNNLTSFPNILPKTVYVSNFAWNFDKLHKTRVSSPITAKKTCFCSDNYEVSEKKSLVETGPISLKITFLQNNLTSTPQILPKNCLCQQLCMNFRQIAQKTFFCTNNCTKDMFLLR